MSMTLEPCKECGSTDVSWSCAPVNNGQAVDGRVCMREVGMRFYRGCGFCGETLEVIDADDFLGKLNAHLARQSEGPSEDDVECAAEAVAEALGRAYDCNRVWNAWDYGTMGPGDFSMVADTPWRTYEIARAALTAVWHNRPVQNPVSDDFPAEISNHDAWPANYANGFNDALRTVAALGFAGRPAQDNAEPVGVVSDKAVKETRDHILARNPMTGDYVKLRIAKPGESYE